MITKFNNFINESFNIKREILIVLDSPKDYYDIKDFLNELEYSNITSRFYDVRIFDNDNHYPVVLIINVDNEEYQANYLTSKDIDELAKVMEENYNLYPDINKFYNDRQCVSYVKNKGVSVPNYSPRKRVLENLNESFSTDKDTAIIIRSPDDFLEIKSLLDKWGYEWANSNFYLDEEFEDDYNFPSVITFFRDRKGKYELHIIDPWDSESEDEGLYWNEYHTTDDFLNDKDAVEYIKYKGVRVPNYKPRRLQ